MSSDKCPSSPVASILVVWRLDLNTRGIILKDDVGKRLREEKEMASLVRMDVIWMPCYVFVLTTT